MEAPCLRYPGLLKMKSTRRFYLDIHGEGVEAHGADEGDAASHGVQEVVLAVHPEALQHGVNIWQNISTNIEWKQFFFL